VTLLGIDESFFVLVSFDALSLAELVEDVGCTMF
jgi:hypothetical protein